MKQYLFFSFCLLAVVTIPNCKCPTDSTDPFKNFNPYDDSLGKRVAAYQQTLFPDTANAVQGNPSLYIDFSSGINQAFAIPANRDFISRIYNSLMDTQLDVYKLGSRTVTAIPSHTPVSIGLMLSTAAEYKDIYAPIGKAVEKIVTHNGESCLITDFEEYDIGNPTTAEVTQIAFLKSYFTEWLSKGNSIRFYCSDYTENRLNKHLYFTIFCCGSIQKSAMIAKAETIFGNAIPHFDLTSQLYTLSQDYTAATKGGVFYDNDSKNSRGQNILDMQEDKYVNGLPMGLPFEFYQFGLDWKTIITLKIDYQKLDKFKDFFRRLFIDVSKQRIYSIEDIDVKTIDISSDFEHFIKCNEALKHIPKLKKDNNQKDIISDDEKDPISLGCYETNGKLREEWKYKPLPHKDMQEVFSFNKVLFTNTIANTGKRKAELGVSFHPNFSDKNTVTPGGLIRVDIVIKTVTTNLSDTALSLFQWPSTTVAGVQNTALLESIKTTMQDEKIKPANKIIYSYYIKTLN